LAINLKAATLWNTRRSPPGGSWVQLIRIDSIRSGEGSGGVTATQKDLREIDIDAVRIEDVTLRLETGG